MKSNNLESIPITILEKLIINWATPLEFIVIKPFTLFMNLNPKVLLYEYFQSQGIWKSIWNSKVDDYKRLIHASNNEDTTKVNRLYNFTLCGIVMNLTYKLLRNNNS